MDTVSTGTESPPPDDLGVVPSDEREEILTEIEEHVRLGRPALGAVGATGASGIALPALVNVGALIMMALAVFIVPRLYDVGERRMVDPTAVSEEAAGLFKALRQEADVQIQERDAEIESLQAQYAKVRSERESLRREFDARVKSRADELQTELTQAIDAEKRRLAGTGLSEAAVDARVRELEARLQAQRSGELEAYAAKLLAESTRREEELATAQARFGEELRLRTDPLATEIQRLTAQGKIQQEAQKDLAGRYDESQAQVGRLEAELNRLAAERDATVAALRHDVLAATTLAARLQKAEAARLALRGRLEEALQRYRPTADRQIADPTALAGRLDLLEAKVETRSIIASEEVQAAHPGLAERLDRFFIESEAEYRADGRRIGIAEAIELIDGLTASPAAGGSGVVARDPDIERFLEKLELLLR